MVGDTSLYKMKVTVITEDYEKATVIEIAEDATVRLKVRFVIFADSVQFLTVD